MAPPISVEPFCFFGIQAATGLSQQTYATSLKQIWAAQPLEAWVPVSGQSGESRHILVLSLRPTHHSCNASPSDPGSHCAMARSKHARRLSIEITGANQNGTLSSVSTSYVTHKFTTHGLATNARPGTVAPPWHGILNSAHGCLRNGILKHQLS